MEANLSGYDLSNSTFGQSNFWEASFIGSTLSGSTFNGTNVWGADFSYAIWKMYGCPTCQWSI